MLIPSESGKRQHAHIGAIFNLKLLIVVNIVK